MRFIRAAMAAVLVLAFIAEFAVAQLQDFGLDGGSSAAVEPEYAATLRVAKGQTEGTLELEMKIPEGFNTYAVTQPKGGAGLPSVMKLPDPKKTGKPNGIKIVGPWSPSEEPTTVVKEGAELQEHFGTVVWTARAVVEEGFDPAKVNVKLSYSGQMCNDKSCVRITSEVPIKYTTEVLESAQDKPASPAPTKSEPKEAKFSGTLGLTTEKAAPKYGATLALVEGTNEGVVAFTLELPKGWKTYDVKEAKGGVGLPSQMNFHDLKMKAKKPTELDFAGPWTPEQAPKVKEELGEDHLVHYGVVIWKARVKFADGADASKLPLKIYYEGQMCSDATKACQPIPKVVDVKLIEPIKKEEAEKLPLFGKEDAPNAVSGQRNSTDFPALANANEPKVGASTDVLEGLAVEGSRVDYPFAVIVLLALGGGFILNFMPCVLPVIGLKIASFVEQAGESRGRVIMLNVYYSLGLLTVFMVLATLAAFWSFGWGQQNQSVVFNIVMASIVFAMGLSMIGVWEIPIPGLAMSTGANKLSQKEGPQGAYFKGVLTTILAVPCSGPGLATAIAYCQNKPPHIIYATFFFLALGMASPYLFIGSFPSLIRFMPKPGEWMETFKQVMGFVLLGTVVFLLTYIPLEYVVPTVALLFGIWMACWWFGRVPMWESGTKRLKAAVLSVGIVSMISAVSFLWLDDIMLERVEKNAIRIADQVKIRLNRGEMNNEAHLAWKPFSVQKLGQLTTEKKTVMVDFTADWCLTCKVLEKTVLNTSAVKEFVEANNIDTLMADWTEDNDEIKESLEKLGSNGQIPVLAIFPASNPKKPIVLIGGYSQQMLLDSLRKACPQETGGAGTSQNVSRGAADRSLASQSTKKSQK